MGNRYDVDVGVDLSPLQRPLCVVGRVRRKKKRARGARWEGEREKRGFRLPPFPPSHRPRRAFYFFDYCYFYRDTQREPLRIQERVPYRCQQLAAQFTVPTSFPGFCQREPGNESAHRSTALNLPSSAQLTAFCTYRLDQLPYFLCFNLVLSLF